LCCCTQGAKIGKKQRGDKLEQLLARNDSSKALRTIYDAYNDEDIVLSKDELRMIMRIRKGQFPHVEVRAALCVVFEHLWLGPVGQWHMRQLRMQGAVFTRRGVGWAGHVWCSYCMGNSSAGSSTGCRRSGAYAPESFYMRIARRESEQRVAAGMLLQLSPPHPTVLACHRCQPAQAVHRVLLWHLLTTGCSLSHYSSSRTF
jgi:hypothetical protein